MNRFPLRLAALLLSGGLVLWLASQPVAAPGPVQDLRTQKVGDQHYFHVRLEVPANLVGETDRDRFERDWWRGTPPDLAPRLVSPDGELRLICRRHNPDGNRIGRIVEQKDLGEAKDRGKDEPRDKNGSAEVVGLEFVGRYDPKAASVKAKLLYPVPGRPLLILGRLQRTPPPVWRELEVTLDFASPRPTPR